MKKFRAIGACVALALAIIAVETASASAAPPELGRCVAVEGVKEGKKTVFNGKYKGKSCHSEAAPGKGKYEWEPGPGEEKEYENPGFLEPATLVTAAGPTIKCSNHKLFGEYTGEKTETANLSLFGCEEATTKNPCENLLEKSGPQESGRIEITELEGTLGYITSAGKPKIGWDLKPKTGPVLIEFECGATLGLGTKYFLEGSVIGEIKPANKSKEEFKGSWKATGAKQEPESFEGGTPDTLKLKYLSGLEPKEEAVGLTMLKEEVDTFEPYEYKA